jgi:hypothetical protein
MISYIGKILIITSIVFQAYVLFLDDVAIA